MPRVNKKRLEANRRMAELKIEITQLIPIWADRAEVMSVFLDLAQWLNKMDLPNSVFKK